MDFLAKMAQGSRERLRRAEARCSADELEQRARAVPAGPALRLSGQGFDLIAEVKKRSPALGRLAAPGHAVADSARAYARGGAAALSVLTEPGAFDGDLSDVTEVSAELPDMPVMRKDFLVSPYQLFEARLAGASGVLLIAAMLADDELEQMLGCALELGLFVLVEAFDAHDIARCAPLLRAAGPAMEGDACRMLIGVNCRDLRSLRVEFHRFGELVDSLPQNIPWVAESGIETPSQVTELAALGFRLALVGGSLMRAADASAAVAELIAAGRR